jgi:hypothetical protein
MRQKLAKRLVGILLGLLVPVLAAEIAARILVAQGTLPNRMPADLFAAHPIGWTLEPNLRAKVPTSGGLIEVNVNATGFRDDNYPTSRVDGRERLLILGDSFTLALELPQEDTFHVQLEDQYDGEVEVISMAASGYEPAQEYLVYQHIGRALDPDIVLVMFYVGNDPVGNQTWPHLPHYTLGASGDLTLRQFPHTGSFDLPIVATQRSTPIMRRSVMAFAAGTIIRQRQQDIALASDDCGYLIAENYPNPGPDDWALTEALILALRDAVEADGKAFRVAIIPLEFQIEQASLDDFMARCQTPDWAVGDEPPQTNLTAIFEENDISYLDLAPALHAARQANGIPMYLPSVDIHWTREGHTAVANALFEWLELDD